ncbi:MAG: sigma-70 family RNA polymerase sigma factor [Planctomycetota bacterium]|nr:sigma-70 family RNA polymerase sigma factor [Planctomycetota bacterium]
MDPTVHVTMLLDAAARGDSQAASDLLPLVYQELRRLASARLNAERGGPQTLEPTALVHEAYMRLLGPGGQELQWDNRGHFFGAAAIAMRRILVDRARAKATIKRSGGGVRVALEPDQIAAEEQSEHLLALDEALGKLKAVDARKHEVVMLRYFAGLSIEETASALSISPATVKNDWVFARAWLARAMGEAPSADATEGA